MRILARLVANALGLLATTIVPGISFTGDWKQLLVASVVLALFNMIVRPFALLLSIPALILTLGLFYFVLNGILLWLASQVIPGYAVSGVFPAGILGALVLGIVNWVLHPLLSPKKKD